MKAKRLREVVRVLRDLDVPLEKNDRSDLIRLSDEREREHVSNVTPTTFDMTAWRCGTAACAIGWCLYDPYFINKGFAIVDACPTFKREESWEAVTKFFDISMDHAIYLFSMGSYQEYDQSPKPHIVANRVDEFIRIVSDYEKLLKQEAGMEYKRLKNKIKKETQ